MIDVINAETADGELSDLTAEQLASYRQTYRAEQLRNERLALRAHAAGNADDYEMHIETAVEHAENLDAVVAEIDRRADLN